MSFYRSFVLLTNRLLDLCAYAAMVVPVLCGMLIVTAR
jgi:hypothetical protein